MYVYYRHRCLFSQPDRTYVRVTERDHRAAVERPLEPPLGRGRIVVNPLITGTGTLQDSMKSFLTAIHSQRLNC